MSPVASVFHRPGATAAIPAARLRQLRAGQPDVSSGGEYIDEPPGPYRQRHIAQTGPEERPAPLAAGKTFGELPFGLLRHPTPGLVLLEKRGGIPAQGFGEHLHCHVLLNDTPAVIGTPR